MLGALAGIAGGIIKGIFGQKAQKQQDQRVDEANRIAQENALRQEALQKEFAQSGIQWKVEDAKKAGIHPLYALGASTATYAPQSVGVSTGDTSGLQSAGQGFGRAVQAAQSLADQNKAVTQAFSAAQLEGVQLDNDIKRAELASRLARNVAQTSMPKVAPTDLWGGVSGDAIKLTDPEIKVQTRRDVADKDNPAYIPGSGPSVGFVRNSTGGWSPIIPPELAESYESDIIGKWDWMLRNRLGPVWSDSYKPPAIPHNPMTEKIEWNANLQQWEIRKRKFKYLGD